MKCVSLMIGFIALLVIGQAVACSSREEKPFNLVTTSPANTYQTHLSERAELDDWPSVGHHHHEVRFTTIFKTNSPIIENELLYDGSTYDDRFLVLFPEHSWVSESILRFGRENKLQASQHDEVSVTNNTDRVIRYLLIRPGKYELFLLLDLRPASSMTLNVQPQTDEGRDLSYVGAKGKFDDGEPLKEVAGNFDIRGKYRGTVHYTVTITNEGILVKSNEFQALP